MLSVSFCRKRNRRKKTKSDHKSGDEDGDSSGKEKRHHKRFRNLRLFSTDFDGGIGRDMAVLFHNNESEANQTDENSANASSGKRRKSNKLQFHHQPQTLLAAPEIHINPPSNQGSPTNSRRGSKV